MARPRSEMVRFREVAQRLDGIFPAGTACYFGPAYSRGRGIVISTRFRDANVAIWLPDIMPRCELSRPSATYLSALARLEVRHGDRLMVRHTDDGRRVCASGRTKYSVGPLWDGRPRVVPPPDGSGVGTALEPGEVWALEAALALSDCLESPSLAVEGQPYRVTGWLRDLGQAARGRYVPWWVTFERR